MFDRKSRQEPDLDEILRQADDFLEEDEDFEPEDFDEDGEYDEEDYEDEDDDYAEDEEDGDEDDEDVTQAYRRLSGMEARERLRRRGIPKEIPAYNPDFRKAAKANARNPEPRGKGCCGCIWVLPLLAALGVAAWLVFRAGGFGF